MGTNRPNPQQHNQQNKQQTHTTQTDQLSQQEQDRVANALKLGEEQEISKIKQALVVGKEPETFKQLLNSLFQKVLLNQIDSQQARLSMHVWFRSLAPDVKETFKQNREQNDLDINRLKGIVETLAQEVPYMYTE